MPEYSGLEYYTCTISIGHSGPKLTKPNTGSLQQKYKLFENQKKKHNINLLPVFDGFTFFSSKSFKSNLFNFLLEILQIELF